MIINPYRFGAGGTAFDGFGNASRSFNGTSDYVFIPDINESTTNLTVALWLKTNDVDWVTTHLAHWRAASSNRAWWIGPSRTAETNGKKLMVFLSGNGTGTNPVKRYYGTTDVSDDTWHHVAFTWGNGTLKLFVDGSEETTTKPFDNTMTSIHDSDGPITVGCTWVNDAPLNYGSGGRADIRIYDAELTASDIADIYAGTDIQTNLVGHWLKDTVDLLDHAGNNDGTNYGSKFSFDHPSPAVEFGNVSRSFVTNDFINLGSSSDLSFGNGSTTDSAFSVCAWVKMNDATNFRVISKAGAYYEWLFNVAGNDKLYWALYDNSGSDYRGLTSTSTLTTHQGSWIHLAATYDGSGGSSAQNGMTMYLTEFGGSTSALSTVDFTSGSYSAMHDTPQDVYIGRFNDNYANGNIADVRIYDKELSSSEVQDLADSTNITTNLVGHWLTNNDDVKDYAGTNDGTNYGSTYSYDNPNAEVEYGQASRDFSGVSQYIVASDIVSIGTGSMSWSFWFETDNTSKTVAMVRQGRNGSSGNARFDGLQVLLDGGKILGAFLDFNNSGLYFQKYSAGSVSLATWYHVALVIDASAETMELYVDGSSEGSVSVSTAAPWNITSTGTPSIGSREISDGNFTGDDMDGKIADVRLYDSALTSTEAYELYKGVDHRTNLISQWLTNSDDVEDKAGTNDGTNYGSTYSTDSPL